MFKRGPFVSKGMLTRSRAPDAVASNTAAAADAAVAAVDAAVDDAAVAASNNAVVAVAPPLSHCGPNQQSSAESNNPRLWTAPVNARASRDYLLF